MQFLVFNLQIIIKPPKFIRSFFVSYLNSSHTGKIIKIKGLIKTVSNPIFCATSFLQINNDNNIESLHTFSNINRIIQNYEVKKKYFHLLRSLDYFKVALLFTNKVFNITELSFNLVILVIKGILNELYSIGVEHVTHGILVYKLENSESFFFKRYSFVEITSIKPFDYSGVNIVEYYFMEKLIKNTNIILVFYSLKNILFPNVVGFRRLKKLIILCLISVSFINFESSRYRMKLCICGKTAEQTSEIFRSIYNFENSKMVLRRKNNSNLIKLFCETLVKTVKTYSDLSITYCAQAYPKILLIPNFSLIESFWNSFDHSFEMIEQASMNIENIFRDCNYNSTNNIVAFYNINLDLSMKIKNEKLDMVIKFVANMFDVIYNIRCKHKLKSKYSAVNNFMCINNKILLVNALKTHNFIEFILLIMKKTKVYINRNTMEFYKTCYLELKNSKRSNIFSLNIAKFIIVAIKLSIYVTKLNMLNNVLN
mmetsp:Transcript_24441/g.43374  ORF Transcript_24441/g.43374 Transcript_24441/m.43374 type:complete len:483 (+) Transcript_24441:66-1514(+)